MTAQGKHTPVPWRVIGDMHGFTSPTAKANTALMEAAPDLLKALEEAEDLLGFHEGSAEKMTETGHPVVWVNNEDLERVLKSIRGAIAKAKGGAS